MGDGGGKAWASARPILPILNYRNISPSRN